MIICNSIIFKLIKNTSWLDIHRLKNGYQMKAWKIVGDIFVSKMLPRMERKQRDIAWANQINRG